MGPIAWTVVGIVVSFGAGFGSAWGLRKSDNTEVLAAHSQSLDHILDGQTELLSEVSKPLVLDAELRSKLADIPVQCLIDLGGDPKSVECQWATCLQYGQSNAQRPECRQIEDLLVAEIKAQSGAR